MPIDRHDAKLLASLKGKGWTFAKNSSQERRMYDLFRADELVRDWRVYRYTPNVTYFRWAYKLPSPTTPGSEP
jgi:hypothetical protein